MPQNEIQTITTTLRKNGDIVIDDEGKPLVVAHYDRLRGHLEFTEKRWSVQLYNQITSQIGTVNKGKDPSGLLIRSIGVKGEAKVDRTKLPPRPKLGPKGDAAEDYVAWMVQHDLPQAIIRYGIYTDENGNPIRKNCRRLSIETVDLRATTDDEDLPWLNVKGKKGQEKSAVFREGSLSDHPNAIIARRATDLTFTAQEVVGGYQPQEDFEEVPGVTDQDEEAGQ